MKGQSRRRSRGAADSHRELTLIDQAIALVATGGAPRVAVAGIEHGADILIVAQRHALAAGLRVRPLRDGNGSVDLLVEQLS
jgi:hypothetical protein